MEADRREIAISLDLSDWAGPGVLAAEMETSARLGGGAMESRGDAEWAPGEHGRNCNAGVLVFVRDAKDGERGIGFSAGWKDRPGSH